MKDSSHRQNNSVERVMNHLETFPKVEPSQRLLSNIELEIDRLYCEVSDFNMRWIIGIAASLLLVIMVNTYVILDYSPSEMVNVNQDEAIEYTFIPTQNLYDE